MGTWTLEVAKMAVYVSFPVAMFYYFNQPQYFEEWVVKTKRELYPPESKEKREKFENAIKAIKQKQELAILAQLENKTDS
nr:unnamed protein product [Callosobruchus chinensis]